jgi:hypothetical protein
VVVVTLKIFNFIHTPTRLDHSHKGVATITVKIPLTALQDILNTLEPYTNYALIRLVKKVDQGRNAAVLDEEPDLKIVSARGSIGDSPSAFLADVKVLRFEPSLC